MADKVKPKYCNIIGRLMNEHGESQNDLAVAIGANRDKVNNWLGGRSKLDIDNLLKIAEHYGVATDYILGKIPEPTEDWNVAKACEYTGLTKYAVEFLNNLKGLSSLERGYLQQYSFVRSFIDSFLDYDTLQHTVNAADNSARAAFKAEGKERGNDALTVNIVDTIAGKKDGLYTLDALDASVFYLQAALDCVAGACSSALNSLIEQETRFYRNSPKIEGAYLYIPESETEGE